MIARVDVRAVPKKQASRVQVRFDDRIVKGGFPDPVIGADQFWMLLQEGFGGREVAEQPFQQFLMLRMRLAHIFRLAGLNGNTIEIDRHESYVEEVENTSSVLPAPPSGLWRGHVKRVTLAKQGRCGERVDARESDGQILWAVLFFDEDTVSGHASLDGKKVVLRGWWGPSKHLRPAVADLSETELWESGAAGIHVQLGSGERPDVLFAWSDGEEIVGYRRWEGG